MSETFVRVIHVVPAIAKEASGPSYSVVRLCESLIAQGQAVTLTALNWAPMQSSHAFLKIFPLGMGPRLLGRSPRMKQWLVGQAELQSVDLIHNHSLWMMPNVYPGWISRKHNIPLIVSPRGTLSEWAFQNGSWVKRCFWPLVQKPALLATTCFHATSDSEYLAIRRMGFKQPVAIIPNGIDIPQPKRPSHNEIRSLLFLGRIHPIKGVDILLQAWRTVSPRFPEWRLRIVGPDNAGYLSKMRSLTVELGLRRVDFSGPLYGDDKLTAYREAELFVLPSHSENFGVAVAEALAAGVPAIVSKGAPWGGLIQYNAGWWVDIGVGPLVACLEDALSGSRDELTAKGLQGRLWMLQEFSWDRIGKMMNETYQWILCGGNKPKWIFER